MNEIITIAVNAIALLAGAVTVVAMFGVIRSGIAESGQPDFFLPPMGADEISR